MTLKQTSEYIMKILFISAVLHFVLGRLGYEPTVHSKLVVFVERSQWTMKIQTGISLTFKLYEIVYMRFIENKSENTDNAERMIRKMTLLTPIVISILMLSLGNEKLSLAYTISINQLFV